jgi:hypothetical protein
MNNQCEFSACRRYRYSLEHVFEPILPLRRVMWIGLNPSTADEQDLDPTLRRIRAFSAAWGFTAFVMTNIFAFRATDPRDMKLAEDPIGPENDATLYRMSQACDAIVACWGAHGAFNARGIQVRTMLASVAPAKSNASGRTPTAARNIRFISAKTFPSYLSRHERTPTTYR